MNAELAKQISFRLSLLKEENQWTWEAVAQGVGLNSAQALKQRMNRGYWPVEELMAVADFFKVPLLYFLVPEERVDEIMGRKEKPEQDAYEIHQAEIKLGKAEAEIRARDKRIEELERELELHQGMEAIIDADSIKEIEVKPAERTLSEISAQHLRLSVKLVQAVAEAMGVSDGL